MSLILYNFEKLLIIFENFFVKLNFFAERFAHKTLGLLLTAQSAFDRERWAHNAPLNTF